MRWAATHSENSSSPGVIIGQRWFWEQPVGRRFFPWALRRGESWEANLCFAPTAACTGSLCLQFQPWRILQEMQPQAATWALFLSTCCHPPSSLSFLPSFLHCNMKLCQILCCLLQVTINQHRQLLHYYFPWPGGYRIAISFGLLLIGKDLRHRYARIRIEALVQVSKEWVDHDLQERYSSVTTDNPKLTSRLLANKRKNADWSLTLRHRQATLMLAVPETKRMQSTAATGNSKNRKIRFKKTQFPYVKDTENSADLYFQTFIQSPSTLLHTSQLSKTPWIEPVEFQR